MNTANFIIGDTSIHLEAHTAGELIADLGLFGIKIAGAIPPAAVTPEKQQAARDSTAAGKAAKAEKAAKDAELTKEQKASIAEGKTTEMTQAQLDKIVADATVNAKPRVYETSGIPDKVSKAVAKNRDAVVALLEKYDAEKDGKLSAKFLDAKHFDDFEKAIDALLAPAEDLG